VQRTKSFAKPSLDAEPKNLTEYVQEAYNELHRMAQQQFHGEQPGRTLQPTALVHETFIRLWRTGPRKYTNRAHFFGCAVKAMRRILLDASRRRGAAKRGGGWERIPLEEVGQDASEQPDYIAIDTALTRLRRFDRKLAKIIELRVFARLTARETAELLSMGESTVRKRWSVGKAWLKREMQTHPQGELLRTI
jgi:RNA polymerase sigma-70 factor, ECF subfamily